MSWSEAKWVVDQIVRKTGRAPNNMRAFSVLAASETSAALRFLEPADSYDAVGNLICSVGGVMVRMSTEDYPAFINEGELAINNTSLGAYENTPFVVTGLTAGAKYYFTAFPYSTQDIFNLSSSGANRAECTPTGVEQVNVSITIDDSSGFTTTTVTCVDETDAAATRTVALTADKCSHAFAVPAGDTYHLSYGEVADYAKPANTAAKAAAAGAVSNYTGAYAYFTATIAVTYPAGAELTCTRGDVSYKATTTTGTHTFTVHQPGVWMIKAVSGEEMAQAAVTIAASGESKTSSLAFFRSTIAVTYPAGSYLTCSSGGETIAADTSTGSYTFTVRKTGVWTIKATNGVKSDEANVVITAPGDAKTVMLTYFSATINVTYPQGCALTCTKGGTILTASSDTSSYQFVVRESGAWTVKASDGTREVEKTVSVADGQTVNVMLEFVSIYGVSRDISSTNTSVDWDRTDDAIGVTNFNNLFPWSEMKRETLSTGDVMVKIPEFWYQRTQEQLSGQLVEHIRIATGEIEGFEKHPGSGLYVGAYKTSSDNKSIRNAVPTVGKTRAVMRASAESKGAGWGLIDAAANSAIQMLFLVEFATNDSQTAIGKGYCYDSSSSPGPIKTGSCDSIKNLTGSTDANSSAADVVYRGIEGVWGNVAEWVDGLNWSRGTDGKGYFVCTDPALYGDATTQGYTKLSYGIPSVSDGTAVLRIITSLGLDPSVPWAMLPRYTTTTYDTVCPDGFNGLQSVWNGACRSGDYTKKNECGIFFFYGFSKEQNSKGAATGSRLLYRPPQENA